MAVTDGTWGASVNSATDLRETLAFSAAHRNHATLNLRKPLIASNNKTVFPATLSGKVHQ
jgi:hypothetical protein